MKLLISLALVCVAAASLPAGLHPDRPRWPRLPEGFHPMDDSRIVGGDLTTIENFPWQAAMYRDGFFMCGAELISETVALTAAHCVHRYESSPRRFQIRVGSTRHYSGTRHQVSEVNKHGSYRPRTFDFDIATMILSTPVSLNAKTQLVEMASGGNQYDGRTATVSGWGTTSEGGNTSPELRCVDVPIVTNSACNAAYGSITSNMLCAGYDAGGKDACQGDSGGPLVINHSCNSMSTDADGDPLLVGVVSWGYGCAAAQYPGVYARVSALRGWVDSNMH